jgi:hypothetical protein
MRAPDGRGTEVGPAVYYMLRDDRDYADLGADYFVCHDKAKLQRSLIARLQRLGLQVEVRPAA